MKILLFLLFPITCLSQSHPSTDDEFEGPFTSWLTVNTTANGIVDNTTALQTAFDAVGQDTSTKSVVYIPAGTYKITQTLHIIGRFNIRIVGADPTTTIIKWAGAPNGTMMNLNGVVYSGFSRITFDGDNIADVLVDQSWDGAYDNGKSYDGGNEYTDCIFKNAEAGLQGGFLGNAFAEVSVMRCQFLNLTSAGATFGNFNALDIWFWYCVFENCYDGLTNRNGAGNFKVYNCIFRSNTDADIYLGATGEFSFRNNYSSNSNAFLLTSFSSNQAAITVQQNTIVDPVQTKCIEVQSQGPVTVMDNIIRSRVGASGTVVRISSYLYATSMTYHNTFTVSSPISQQWAYDTLTTVVTRASLAGLGEPTLPTFRPNLNRTVFEVPAGASAATIQTAINNATAEGNRSVVHLAQGIYSINATLTIPLNSDVQIIGDVDGDRHPTLLRAQSGLTAPVIQIYGPSKATLSYFSVDAYSGGEGIVITGVDQPGSRIYMNQLQTHGNGANLLVNGQTNTKVLSENGGYSSAHTGTGVYVNASDSVILYAGSASDNLTSFVVANGGKLFVRDLWYESNSLTHYLDVSGNSNFIVDGSHISSTAVGSPQITIHNATGKMFFSGSYISNNIWLTGSNNTGKLYLVNVVSGLAPALGSGKLIDNSTVVSNPNFVGFLLRVTDPDPNASGSGSSEYANIDNFPPPSALADFYSQLSSVTPTILTPTPDGTTDLRIHRIWTINGINGFRIGAALTETPLTLNGAQIRGRRIITP